MAAFVYLNVPTYLICKLNLKFRYLPKNNLIKSAMYRIYSPKQIKAIPILP